MAPDCSFYFLKMHTYSLNIKMTIMEQILDAPYCIGTVTQHQALLNTINHCQVWL